MTILYICLAVVVVMLGYVRLAPSDPTRWHVATEASQDRNFDSGAVRVVETGPQGLERFDTVARSAPRTIALAGSVSEGMVTYIQRSKWLGFPDYITAQQDGSTLRLLSRQRFGLRDLGVNARRLDDWVARMDQPG
ncbi:DUF1499 domain-containing protein [Lutimaribacter marinistellae]|uniref:DUF1499 domain-containing protein n=1 Tax=Lutimaribacter marinistellae TaxID=1820329 RepID=A0ABV7TJZ2_9RHOB